MSALRDATTVPEILEAVARAVWAKNHDGAVCPAEQIPTEAELAAWLPEWPERGTGPGLECLDPEPGVAWGWHALGGQSGPDPNGRLWNPDPSEGQELLAIGWGPVTRTDEDGRQWADRPPHLLSARQVHAAWKALPDPRPPHPLAALVRAWQGRPVEVERSNHPFPLWPNMRIGEPVERERGRRLFGLVPPNREAQLPLFPDVEHESLGILERVPLLALSDASGAPVSSQGAGAPLELAIPVESVLSLYPKDRAQDKTVSLAISVREFRDAFWPPPHSWRLGQDWPRLKGALEGLNSRPIPWDGGGKWYLVLLRGLPPDPRPRRREDLDRLVYLELKLPPGSDQGGPMDRRRLSELRVSSGGGYRALIAATGLTWDPGHTRVKHSRSGTWVWAGDPGQYPVLSWQDRHDIVFGSGGHKRHRNTEVNGPFDLLEEAGDIWIQDRSAFDPKRHVYGWRLIPRAAIKVVRNWVAKRERRGGS